MTFSPPPLKRLISLDSLLVIALIIGVLLRLLNLGTRELWYDEVLSLLLSTGQKIHYNTPQESPVLLSQLTPLLSLPIESGKHTIAQTLQGLLRGLYAGEPHPPLFFLAQHLWLRLWGNGEIALRSLPMLWSFGAIAAAYGFGQSLLGTRSGLLFAALLATNPFYLFHSLNVRMYTPLTLWAILSAWALVELIGIKQAKTRIQWRWGLVLVGTIAAGLMTFYLFVYWVVALAGLAIMLDRWQCWKHGLWLAAGVSLSIPWMVWGALKQFQNADLDRFNTAKQAGNNSLIHLQDVVQTLGVQLVVGDWVTSVPSVAVLLAGTIAGTLLVILIGFLWKRGNRTHLIIGVSMGVVPLLLALSVDIIAGKFTLGFGWGRAISFILPGCLLLITLGIERSGRWREVAATGLLLMYLTIGVSDFNLRSRQVFHQITSLIQREPIVPTLIVMNSQAWGHVNRLAYYVPPNLPVSLLAQPSEKLASALDKAMTKTSYRQVLWLESAAPIWSPATTNPEHQQIENLLRNRFQGFTNVSLSGTMNLDQFEAALFLSPIPRS
jgi:uncharacterized membrane protein